MGIAKNISATEWPKQGEYLAQRCRVCFKYDTSQEVMGTIVRDDFEEPWLTIIRLDDGRVVLGTECMFAPEAGAPGFLTNHQPFSGHPQRVITTDTVTGVQSERLLSAGLKEGRCHYCNRICADCFYKRQ